MTKSVPVPISLKYIEDIMKQMKVMPFAKTNKNEAQN